MTEELTRDLHRLVHDAPETRDPGYAELVWRAGRRRRTSARVVSALAAVAVALVAVAAIVSIAAPRDSDAPLPATSASTPHMGLLIGRVPLCYGPLVNLTPTLVVVAMQNGETKATVTVPATEAAPSYQLTLPPGTYTVRAGTWPTREATVRAGETTVADLPGGNCL